MGKIRLEGLTKRFGNLVAVDDLSLEVRDGERLCLLGPPGAGKTTIMRMIAGVEKPDEGNIYIDDTLVNDIPPKDRDVAMVFQSYALYSHKTVYENLAYPLRKRRLSEPEIKKRVEEVAENLGIKPLLGRLPRQLSGGEKQRVALGRAIVRMPKAYLLDEPLTNLDALLRAHMRGELKRLSKELKTTIVYATPDQLEAMSIADRIAVMNLGNLLQCETPDVLYDHPKDMFVAGFIGSPAMNFIDCTFKEKDGRALLDASDFTYDVTQFRDLLKGRLTSSEVMLGIRPEHILIGKTRQNKDSIESEVYVVEPARPEIVVNVKIGKRILKVLAPEMFHADMGEKVWLRFDRNKVHIFDKKTQKTII